MVAGPLSNIPLFSPRLRAGNDNRIFIDEEYISMYLGGIMDTHGLKYIYVRYIKIYLCKS